MLLHSFVSVLCVRWWLIRSYLASTPAFWHLVFFPQHVTDWAEEFDDEDSFQINETKTPVSVRTAAIRRSFLPIEKRKAARTRTLQRVHTHFAVMVGGGEEGHKSAQSAFIVLVLYTPNISLSCMREMTGKGNG